MKAPHVVYPLVRIGDEKTWVTITEHAYWLRRACEERKGQTHWNELFQSAVSELRRTLKTSLDQKTDAPEAERRKLRAQLGLADEDRDEDMVKPQRKRARTSEPEAKVMLGETELTVRVQERPLLVEATPKSVLAIIAFCQSHVRAGVPKLKKDQPKPASKESLEEDPVAHYSLPEVVCQPILGKLTWHPSVCSWSIHWRDSAGKLKQKRVTPRALGEGKVHQQVSWGP